MRVELGPEVSPVQMVEFISKNQEGKFIAIDNKIYFDTNVVPTLTFKNNQPQAQQSTQPRRNPFAAMGDEINKMCGL